MSKVFNNTDKNVPAEKGLTLNGWQSTTPYNATRVAHITDTVGAGIAISKMGTSIPTPFARIFLFDSAFSQVNALGHNADNVYSRLVSECLDFLEFLFNFGNDITVKAWNVNNEINNLMNSPHNGHKLLGNSLQQFALDLGVQDIYLLYYGGELVGGTSPYTLLFTSPNWQRKKKGTFQGIAGNVLFPDYSDPHTLPTPLHQRDVAFRKYLTEYIVAFSAVPAVANSHLRRYIFDNQATYDNEMATYYNSITGATPFTLAQMSANYTTLSAGAAVDVKGQGGANAIMLFYTGRVAAPPAIANDYKIQATSTRYQANIDAAQVPLVLNQFGVTGATYIGGNPWDTHTALIEDSTIDLNTRVLPGGGSITYPYLTVDDFLEDKLIKMPFELNATAFNTFGCQLPYLPPFKKTFFEYFDIADINTLKGLKYELVETPDGSVKVTLTVPIAFAPQGYISLERTYAIEDIVNVENVGGFSFAIFPSYRINTGNVPNIYSVLMHDESKHHDLAASFYSISNTGVDKVDVKVTDSVRRMDRSYTRVQQAFDFIEVDWGGAKALLVPMFKEVQPNVAANNTVVGIDFGTTNSYVAISYDGGDDPEALDITTNDLQVLLLNKVDLSHGLGDTKYLQSISNMPSFGQSLDREFAPLLLGTHTDVQLPYRTVTCESDGFTGKAAPHLFGHINIGFNFLKENFGVKGIKYDTNVKWGIEDPSSAGLTDRQNRAKAFCTQMAWMVKNKIMLGGHASTTFTVFLTYPYTMSLPTRTKLNGYWRAAFDEVMGAGNVTINRLTESIAPYYYMIAHGANFTANALNIDVGGGTTDMLFADVMNQRFYYDSSLFAGNDIWGDGKKLIGGTHKDNGFVTYFETLLNGGSLPASPERKAAYQAYKQNVENSADLMNYIFRYNDEFNFVSYIQNSTDKLMPVFYLHLGALIYHVAQVLKVKNIAVPRTISFSGMGAKYIQMISPEAADITPLVKTLLAEFMGYGYNDRDNQMPQGFTVNFQASPKEVTAQGAIYDGNNALNAIHAYGKKEFYVYGFENAPEAITYGDSEQYKTQVLESFNVFVKAFLENEGLTKFLNRIYGVSFSDAFIDKVKETADQSFDVMTRTRDATADVEETLFFWPLKNALYETSKL